MSNLKETIANFLTSDEKEISIPMVPIRDVETILKEEHGFNDLELDGGETNGWQIDFWYDFYKEGELKSITLHGSLHYGDFKLRTNE